MPLIKSISGIRGTLGNREGEDLTLADVRKFTMAFAQFLKEKKWGDKIVIGRDARPSGLEFKKIISKALSESSFKVIDLDLATTPTVEIAVIEEKAAGGLIITASHNPIEWNALKLLNNQGEFLSASDGHRVLELAADDVIPSGDKSGCIADELTENIFPTIKYEEQHINLAQNLPLVDKDSIKKANFKIVVDGINSVGGIVIPKLLRALGVVDIIELNCEPNGNFAHKPEPLAENLKSLMELVIKERADLGIVVDPDVDRLAFIDEKGQMFGEEYTLVAIANYVLENFTLLAKLSPEKYKKAAVSNLSSTRALKDITTTHGGQYEAAAVGEVNVVTKMKESQAIIGGEGNGGIIFPEAHYGRDALVGTSLFLSALARSHKKISDWRRVFPEYFMVKDKLELQTAFDLSVIFQKIKQDYQGEKITDIDGVKIDWADSWVHLRASNTEPIIRIYAEAKTETLAKERIKEINDKILAYIK